MSAPRPAVHVTYHAAPSTTLFECAGTYLEIDDETFELVSYSFEPAETSMLRGFAACCVAAADKIEGRRNG